MDSSLIENSEHAKSMGNNACLRPTPFTDEIMQATTSALTHFEKNIDATTIGHDAMQVMQTLAENASTSGLNIWTENDEGEICYHVEYKDKHITSHNLAYAILEAAGRMPRRECSRCHREKSITAFVRKQNSANGFSFTCNLCNRLKHKSRTASALAGVSERPL